MSDIEIFVSSTGKLWSSSVTCRISHCLQIHGHVRVSLVGLALFFRTLSVHMFCVLPDLLRVSVVVDRALSPHVVCQVARPCSEVLLGASLRLCVYLSGRCWTQEDPFIESVPDVDSRRSARNRVVFTVNDSVAKFVSVACTCKSDHWLYPVSGNHFGVSPGEYRRFEFDWEITSGECFCIQAREGHQRIHVYGSLHILCFLNG